jgi:dihydroflavonol-4-reductase
MNKVLITGASGFLGSNLTRELFRLGYEVRIMVRPGAGLTVVSDIPCEMYFGNIDNKEHVSQAVAGCDVVIHAAAVTEQWSVPYSAYERINYTGTRHMVDACLEHQVSRFIYVSTANTMSPGSKANPGSELNGFTLFDANSGYINTKYLAQQYVLEQVESRKLPAVIVNPTFMIGPNDVKPSSGKLLLYGMHKKVLFYPPGGKNFVHINDVCQGIVNTITNGKVGDCYLLAGENLSFKEFFQTVNKVSGQHNIMIKIPALLFKMAGYIGSMLQKVTGISGKLNYTSAYLMCLDNYYSGRKSERELALHYTPVEMAIQQAMTWFKENKYC